MRYKIIRLDGKEDSLTKFTYGSYDEAHLILEDIFGNSCCSDVDYDDLPGYDIIKI